MGIYKRKQESKKTRKKGKKEVDQEKKKQGRKKELDQESDQENKKTIAFLVEFFFFLI